MEEILKILESLPGPMRPNETLLMVAFIFLLLIVVLNTLIFKPLLHILEDRETRIREGEEAAATAAQTVAASNARYEQALIAARREGQGFRQDLLKEAKVECEKTVTHSREQAMAQVQAAVTELDQQVASARNSLDNEAELLAKQIVSAVLSRNPAA